MQILSTHTTYMHIHTPKNHTTHSLTPPDPTWESSWLMTTARYQRLSILELALHTRPRAMSLGARTGSMLTDVFNLAIICSNSSNLENSWT